MSPLPERTSSSRALATALLGLALLASAGCSRSSASVARARGVDDLPARWLERELRVNVSVQGASLDASHAAALVQDPCVSLERARKAGDRRPGCSTLQPVEQSLAMQPDPLGNPWPDGIRPNRAERDALSELYAWHAP